MDVWGMEIGIGEIVSGFIRLLIAIWVAYLFSHYFVKGFLNN